MNNHAPISEGGLSNAWANWFMQADLALAGWVKSFSIAATLDFPSIPAQSQQALTVTIKGARQGDAVTVTPAADVAGLIFTGVVTGNDAVTVYAKNFSSGAINPAAQSFRIIVLQS